MTISDVRLAMFLVDSVHTQILRTLNILLVSQQEAFEYIQRATTAEKVLKIREFYSRIKAAAIERLIPFARPLPRGSRSSAFALRSSLPTNDDEQQRPALDAYNIPLLYL